jgi:hypothetical protein
MDPRGGRGGPRPPARARGPLGASGGGLPCGGAGGGACWPPRASGPTKGLKLYRGRRSLAAAMHWERESARVGGRGRGSSGRGWLCLPIAPQRVAGFGRARARVRERAACCAPKDGSTRAAAAAGAPGGAWGARRAVARRRPGAGPGGWRAVALNPAAAGRARLKKAPARTNVPLVGALHGGPAGVRGGCTQDTTARRRASAPGQGGEGQWVRKGAMAWLWGGSDADGPKQSASLMGTHRGVNHGRWRGRPRPPSTKKRSRRQNKAPLVAGATGSVRTAAGQPAPAGVAFKAAARRLGRRGGRAAAAVGIPGRSSRRVTRGRSAAAPW